jgi:hypothetical protein
MLVTFTAKGTRSFGQAQLAQARNLPMRSIVEAHRKITAGELRGARAAGGSTWPKRKAFPGGRPAGSASLSDGKLYGAVVGGRGRAGSYTRIGKTTASWGVTLPYARYHREGATIKVTARQRAYLHYRGVHLRPSTTTIRIPARPWGGDSRELRRRAEQILLAHFGVGGAPAPLMVTK